MARPGRFRMPRQGPLRLAPTISTLLPGRSTSAETRSGPIGTERSTS